MKGAAPATEEEPDDDLHPRPPFSSRAQAGPPSPADDGAEGRVNLNRFIFRNPGATTIHRVRDGSLRAFGVFEGDLLVIDSSLAPEGGRLVLVEIDGGQAVRLLVRSQGTLFLADAADAGGRRVEFREGEGPKLLGVVTHSIHTLDG